MKRTRSPRDCFECCDTTHFITNCPKRKKLNSSSNKYKYTKQNGYNKGDDKKKHHFGDKKKKKSRRSCLEHVPLSVILSSLVTTPPTQRRMRRSSASQTTSPGFASWANLRDTSLTPM
jgi:hypothetical protein